MNLLALILLLLNWMPAVVHDVESDVIIDTDAAPDDLRAICLLLAMPELRVLGITVGDGSSAPADGGAKVLSLLQTLGREDIPVGIGPRRLKDPPPWREFCTAFAWGEKNPGGEAEPPAADALLSEQLRSSAAPVMLVCLGPLSNAAEILRAEPSLKQRILRILWYNDEVDPPAGTNYELDRESADFVLNSGVSVEVLSNTGEKGVAFDEDMLRKVEGIGTLFAGAIAGTHSQPAALARVRGGHFKIWDELLPVYLRNPSAFEMEESRNNALVKISRGFDREGVLATYQEILMARHVHYTNVVFESFPADPEQFREDLRPLVREIFERHGEEEWRTIVLTNELHRHLGIYSIAGAKMGLYALQYLGAERDEARVVSFAGSMPPVSCFNDGLQVSTGATVGHGSLTVEPVETAVPEAVISCGNGTLRLRLRDGYLQQIRADIRRGIEQHGNLTPGYWAFVRALAIRYWLEWDRYEMFEIVEQDLK